MEKLTPEQAKLVEDNHNLIYHVLLKYHWDIDKYYGIAAIGLCNAAKMFDPTKGIKFSTYACIAIKNQVLYDKRKRQLPIDFSLDERFYINDKGDNASKGDLIEDSTNLIDDVIFELALKETLGKLDEKHRRTLELKMQGVDQTTIGEMEGITQGSVSRRLKRIKEMICT